MIWGVADLTVRFSGVAALSSVSISVASGAVHAVVGGDGAGKTTLLRVLAGIGLNQEGTVRLPPPGGTGYVPPAGGVFADLSLEENMQFVADAYQLSGWNDRSQRLLERSGIAQFGSRLAGNLSGGQRRKLAGSMALLPKPELLVLDEVTTGVDPVSRMDLWRLIAGAAADGAAVVVATSYLDEAERAAAVLLLHRGRVLASGTPNAIVSGIRGTVVDREAPKDRSRAWRKGRQWREWNPEGDDGEVDGMTLEDAAIVSEMVAEGEVR